MNSGKKQSERVLYNELSSLAGFAWGNRPSPQILPNALPQVSLNSVDPFFEILGEWNFAQRQNTIDPDRCAWAAKRFKVPSTTIERITTVHFLAHAVLALGKANETNASYKRWRAEQTLYRDESNRMTCSHHHYAELIRSEELFVQILSYLYLSDPARSVQDELKAFKRLSEGGKGRDDLYSLDPKHDSIDHRTSPGKCLDCPQLARKGHKRCQSCERIRQSARAMRKSLERGRKQRQKEFYAPIQPPTLGVRPTAEEASWTPKKQYKGEVRRRKRHQLQPDIARTHNRKLMARHAAITKCNPLEQSISSIHRMDGLPVGDMNECIECGQKGQTWRRPFADRAGLRQNVSTVASDWAHERGRTVVTAKAGAAPRVVNRLLLTQEHRLHTRRAQAVLALY